MTRVKVSVTAEDIRVGVPRDQYRCPVARAIKRRLKSHDVSVGTWIFIDVLIDVETPPQVLRWIRAFDEQRPVGPFAFYLVIHKKGRR